jgi:acyl-CoA thioesterase
LLLYSSCRPTSSCVCCLARGELYTEDGTLVVSVVQEGLIRRPG